VLRHFMSTTSPAAYSPEPWRERLRRGAPAVDA
jgi:hypothetical protein